MLSTKHINTYARYSYITREAKSTSELKAVRVLWLSSMGYSFVVYEMRPLTKAKKLFAKTIHVSYWLSKKGFSSVIYEMRNLTKAKK